MMLKTSAVYMRAHDERSLEVQKNTSIAATNNMSQVVTYCDNGRTGTALRELQTDITAEKIDTVIVYSLDRISRDVYKVMRFIRLAQEHQVHIIVGQEQNRIL